MKTFKGFINEMAYISGKHDNNSFSLKLDWDNHFKEKAHLIIDKIPKNYKIYSYMNYYFLTDKNNEYLGYIQLKDVSKIYNIKETFQIKTSNSSGIVKGFYNIMFTSILVRTNIKCILSDGNLSSNAVKSYERLNKESKLNILLLDRLSKEIIPFDKKELIRNANTIVMVTGNAEIFEIYKIYKEKIENDLAYQNDLINENNSLYIMLYTKYEEN